MIFNETRIFVLKLISVLAIIFSVVALISKFKTGVKDSNEYNCERWFVVYPGKIYKGVVEDKFINLSHASKTLLISFEDDLTYCFPQENGGLKSLYHMAFTGDSIYSSDDGESLILNKGNKEFEYAIYQTDGYN